MQMDKTRWRGGAYKLVGGSVWKAADAMEDATWSNRGCRVRRELLRAAAILLAEGASPTNCAATA